MSATSDGRPAAQGPCRERPAHAAAGARRRGTRARRQRRPPRAADGAATTAARRRRAKRATPVDHDRGRRRRRTPRSPRKSRTSPTTGSRSIDDRVLRALIFADVAHAEGDAAHQAAADQARVQAGGHLRRHRRRRRGQGRAAGDRRVPARPQGVPRSSARRCRRGSCCTGRPGTGKTLLAKAVANESGAAVLRAVGGLFRGDVRGPRRGAHQAPVRGRPQARTGDHLHRRARRRRRPPRLGHLRREGPDAQPAAGRDGRLRLRAGGSS